ncbi:MAG: SPOR domain-containing protein [Candidatus Neomarinimicrobiota bacterium]|tara:strand:+ start:454 stop:1341 length:888 start_codon:yes stop_codon:yes gene_type:complete
MRKIQIFFLLLFFGCGGSGIEGYVDEPITITANNPEEGQDVDYFWSLAEQPDGSLINSGDLLASDDGQEMIFTPDYPGDYLIEVVISQYGDEISNQTFSFTILDISDKEISNNEDVEKDNEDWLNEEIEDSLEEDTEKITKDSVNESQNESIQPEKISNSNSELMSNKDKEGSAAMTQMAKEKETDPLSEFDKSNKVVAKIKEPKREASISERTDRFTIQITSKKMLKDAQLFSQDLIGQGYDSYIQKIVFNSEEIWYRVRVGSYDNYNSAKTAADALSSEIGMPTWVDFVRKEQ